MTLLAAIGFLLVAGCKDFPGADGRYATPARGGWDNFRAGAAPFHEHGMLAMNPYIRNGNDVGSKRSVV